MGILLFYLMFEERPAGDWNIPYSIDRAMGW